MNEQEQNVRLELTDEIGQGQYSNCTVVAHSSSEFIIDFARIVPGIPKVSVKSRIIMAPEQVKRLMLTLQDNIRKYEEDFGPIRIHENEMGMPLSSVKGEA